MPKTLMLKLISLKGIIIIPITKIMVIDFLTMAEVVVVIVAKMEEEVMLVEEMVATVVGLQTFNAEFVTNMVMKLPFATIAMKKIMFLHSQWSENTQTTSSTQQAFTQQVVT